MGRRPLCAEQVGGRQSRGPGVDETRDPQHTEGPG